MYAGGGPVSGSLIYTQPSIYTHRPNNFDSGNILDSQQPFPRYTIRSSIFHCNIYRLFLCLCALPACVEKMRKNKGGGGAPFSFLCLRFS